MLIIGALIVIQFPNVFIPCDAMDCYTQDTTTIDSIFIPGKDSIYERPGDTVKVPYIPAGYVKREAINDSVTRYVHTFEDSLLTAHVVAYVRGIIDTSYLSYEFIMPPIKEIYRTDTLRINTTVQIKPKRFHQFYATGTIGGSPAAFMYGLGAVYVPPRNNMIFKADYLINPQLGNMLLIGAGIPLFKIPSK